MSASQSDSSFGNMIELAEIISDRSAVSEPVAEMNVGTSTKKRISKTSMLFAILGSRQYYEFIMSFIRFV